MTNVPPRPERPPLPEKQRSSGSTFWTLVLAMLMAVAGIASLVVMPLVGYVPVIVLAVFAFAGLHYFVWGWWLSKSIQDAEAARQAAEENSRKGSP